MASKFPRMYISGFRATSKGEKPGSKKVDLEFIDKAGIKYRCMNFGYVCPGAFCYSPRVETTYEASKDRKVGIMMDSAAYTLQKMWAKGSSLGKMSSKDKRFTHSEYDKLCESVLEDYARFCHKEKKFWDFFVTFDYRRDCDVIYGVTKKLEQMGLHPAPVYHGDKSLDYFRRYCDEGYKVVCISLSFSQTKKFMRKKLWLERIFRIAEPYGTKLHGLAITDLYSMTEYPWWAVDSATWAKTASFGAIPVISKERNVIDTAHVSTRHSESPVSYNRLPKVMQKELEELVEGHGFDFQRVREDLPYRSMYNAFVFANLDSLLEKGSTGAKWESLLDIKDGILK